MNKFAAVLFLLSPGWAWERCRGFLQRGFHGEADVYDPRASGRGVRGFIHHVGEWWNPQHSYSAGRFAQSEHRRRNPWDASAKSCPTGRCVIWKF